MVFQGSFKGISRLFFGCFKEVPRKFHGRLKDVSKKFPVCVESISRVFQGSCMGIKEVSCGYQERFNQGLLGACKSRASAQKEKGFIFEVVKSFAFVFPFFWCCPHF